MPEEFPSPSLPFFDAENLEGLTLWKPASLPWRPSTGVRFLFLPEFFLLPLPCSELDVVLRTWRRCFKSTTIFSFRVSFPYIRVSLRLCPSRSLDCWSSPPPSPHPGGRRWFPSSDLMPPGCSSARPAFGLSPPWPASLHPFSDLKQAQTTSPTARLSSQRLFLYSATQVGLSFWFPFA